MDAKYCDSTSGISDNFFIPKSTELFGICLSYLKTLIFLSLGEILGTVYQAATWTYP